MHACFIPKKPPLMLLWDFPHFPCAAMSQKDAILAQAHHLWVPLAAVILVFNAPIYFHDFPKLPFHLKTQARTC